MRSKILSLLLVVSVLFSFPLQGVASNPTESELENIIKEQLENVQEIKDVHIKQEYIELFTDLDFERTSTIYDYENSRLIQIDGDETVALTIPIQQKKVRTHEFSNFTVYFNKDKEAISTTEILVTESELNTFKTQYFVDNEELVNEITNEPFKTAEEIKRGDSGTISALFNVNGFLACMGISTAFMGPIIGACTAACIVPGAGTAICALCLGALIGIPSGTLTVCLQQNW